MIATSWPEARQKEFEEGFRRWLGDRSEPVPRIVWVALEPGDDPGRFARRRALMTGLSPRPVDVLIGGPATCYRRLARDGKLVAAGGGHPHAWLAIRRSPIEWATFPWKGGNLDGVRTFDDPRHDPLALEWARGSLGSGAWSEGYARLVREASQPRRIGRQAGSGLAAVERGEVTTAPAIANEVRPPIQVEPALPPIDRSEGVAIVAGTRHPREANQFLAFLAETGEAEAPAGDPVDDAELDSLLADLLGATLVDAQDELWAGWGALRKATFNARAEAWMTEAPPWPPASVVKLGERDGTGALLHDLVEQIAPQPEVRAWLLRSWLAPGRPIDGAVLGELARAVDGRLAREPRFRAWLRAEWTAWARQRYRRVARQAGGTLP